MMFLRACFFVMIVVVFERTKAQNLACYNCSKVVGASGSTCPDNFQQTDGVNICQGKACIIIGYEGRGYGTKAEATCLTNEFDDFLQGQRISLKVMFCEMLNQLQHMHHFYIRDGMCCTTQEQTSDGHSTVDSFNKTICACDTNHCNRNLTNFLSEAGLTTEAQSMVLPTTSSGSMKVLEQTGPLTCIIVIIFAFNVIRLLRSYN